MYVEKESGTVGSTVGEERGEGVDLKMIDGSFRCHVCHETLSAYGPHLPYTHTHTHTHTQRAHVYNIHTFTMPFTSWQ